VTFCSGLQNHVATDKPNHSSLTFWKSLLWLYTKLSIILPRYMRTAHHNFP